MKSNPPRRHYNIFMHNVNSYVAQYVLCDIQLQYGYVEPIFGSCFGSV